MRFYTRPQDGFIEAGTGGGICWALVDDITHAIVKEETVVEQRYYHTIKEVKNGEVLILSKRHRDGCTSRMESVLAQQDSGMCCICT